ncbi:hypothetical protein KEM56_001872 [Ascosphaera pollenicola]|nr:hypothetical protein KEM56_001872 [Ascosphaera pollenicola]
MPYLCKTLSSFELPIATGWQSAIAAAVLGVGGLYLVGKLLCWTVTLLSIFVLPGKPLKSFGPRGSWALVTGASDGIGREFALQIANAGYNVLLVSRTQSKLDAVASEIKGKHHNVETKTLAMDFARNDDADYERLKALCDDLDISILVNNVGLSHSIPVPFALTDDKEMADIININCTGTLRVTKLVVPGMQQRKRGLILTMGSFGGLFPTPLLATYSGSKAFLQQWSTALGGELEPYGITVELIQSFLVTSAMSKIRRSSWNIPTPRNFVKSVLSKIGRGSGSKYAHTSAPFWAHGLMVWIVSETVGVMSRFALSQNKKMHENIRMRALRKAEREAAKKAN